MLIPRVHIQQVGILAGCKVVELDLRRGILVRRIKATELIEQIKAAPSALFLYLKLSNNNLQDKALPKLIDKLRILNMKIYISTDSSNPIGLSTVLHNLVGIELNFSNPNLQDIKRICLLAATRELQLNLTFDQTSDLDIFFPLFAQLKLSNINIYLPNLENIGELPDNIRVFQIPNSSN